MPSNGVNAQSRVRIEDVAQAAGVSTATVSFVLAGKTAVAPATRARVLEAVAQLGYRRNRHARALRRGGTSTAAMVLPDITNPFYAELYAAVDRAAQTAGWNVVVASSQVDTAREVAVLQQAIEDEPDVVLYLPLTTTAIEAAMLPHSAPVILLDEAIPMAGAGSVTIDNDLGGRLVARHFVDTGRRRAFVAGTPAGLPSSKRRVSGFLDEAVRLGLDVVDVVFANLSTLDGAVTAAERLLADRSIDAFFAGNDVLAIRVMASLLQQGVSVPDDVAICGFDGITLGQAMRPQLTTIQQPFDALGTAALRLAQLAASPAAHVREDVVLPVTLTVGDTT